MVAMRARDGKVNATKRRIHLSVRAGQKRGAC